MWPFLGGLAGGLFSFFGQRQTNQANVSAANAANLLAVQESARNREFQSEQAQISRDWMERMSNTAIRRARTDMEAAGFNPLLALPSGASSPGAGIPGGSSASTQFAMRKNPLENLPKDVGTAAQIRNQMKLIDSQAMLMRSQRRTEASKQALNYANAARNKMDVNLGLFRSSAHTLRNALLSIMGVKPKLVMDYDRRN